MIVDEYILIRYIDGTLPDDERSQVDDWVAASPENAKLLFYPAGDRPRTGDGVGRSRNGPGPFQIESS